MIFSFSKTIYGYECDVYGHLNNANYLHLLEAARSEAMVDIGLPIAKLNAMGIQFFVYRVEMDFLRAVELDEIATVKSCFFEMNRLKGRWKQEVYNPRGEKCLSATLTVVFAGDGVAKRLPVDVYDQIRAYGETEQDEKPAGK